MYICIPLGLSIIVEEETEVEIVHVDVPGDCGGTGGAWPHVLPVKCHPDVPVYQRGVGWCSVIVDLVRNQGAVHCIQAAVVRCAARPCAPPLRVAGVAHPTEPTPAGVLLVL